MNNSDEVLQAKVDFMSKDLQVIAEKVRHIISPLSAIKLYIDDMMEDSDYKEYKSRLSDIDRVADKCISIARDLVELTMPYFDSKLTK